MAVVNPVRTVARGAQQVDIAGVRWPVYKVEALALALLTGLVLLLVTGSAQAAVLVAAAVAALRWGVAAAVRLIRPAP